MLQIPWLERSVDVVMETQGFVETYRLCSVVIISLCMMESGGALKMLYLLLLVIVYCSERLIEFVVFTCPRWQLNSHKCHEFITTADDTLFVHVDWLIAFSLQKNVVKHFIKMSVQCCVLKRLKVMDASFNHDASDTNLPVLGRSCTLWQKRLQSWNIIHCKKSDLYLSVFHFKDETNKQL